MSYLDDAAAELAKIRSANDDRADRATALREDGQADLADAADAEVTGTSFRLADAYMALAVIARDDGPPAVAPDPEEDPGD